MGRGYHKNIKKERNKGLVQLIKKEGSVLAVIHHIIALLFALTMHEVLQLKNIEWKIKTLAIHPYFAVVSCKKQNSEGF